MTWIEALRDQPALWADFKADLEGRIQRELRRMLTVRGDDLLVVKGIAVGLQGFLDGAVAKEREEHADAVRRARESGRSKD